MVLDLQKVREKLGSASPKWFELGLALGLSHPDLTNIKEEYGDNNKCFREMLAKVLETQRVTWGLLSDGLKKSNVGLYVLADTIAGNNFNVYVYTMYCTQRCVFYRIRLC